MSVQVSQLRAVRQQMRNAWRFRERENSATTPAPVKAIPTPRIAPPLAIVDDLRVIEGERRDADLPEVLSEVVASVSAVDGAVAVEQGRDLRITTSARGLIGRRTISREMSPMMWEAIATQEPRWLADPTAAGIHLPPHAQVLVIPFSAGSRSAVAILSFHRRRSFSSADLRSVTDALTQATPAPAPRDRAVRVVAA